VEIIYAEGVFSALDLIPSTSKKKKEKETVKSIK
jgi:hypothetical protein